MSRNEAVWVSEATAAEFIVAVPNSSLVKLPDAFAILMHPAFVSRDPVRSHFYMALLFKVMCSVTGSHKINRLPDISCS